MTLVSGELQFGHNMGLSGYRSGFYFLDSGVMDDAQEIAEDVFAGAGCVGFRMELHSIDRVLIMAQGHDLPFSGLGDDGQAGWQGRTLDDERVVTGCDERVFNPMKKCISEMMDGRSHAVHQPIRMDDIAAKMLSEALMPQAYAENRQAV